MLTCALLPRSVHHRRGVPDPPAAAAHAEGPQAEPQHGGHAGAAPPPHCLRQRGDISDTFNFTLSKILPFLCHFLSNYCANFVLSVFSA